MNRYDETDGASKGIVSSLTNLVNAITSNPKKSNNNSNPFYSTTEPPTSPQQLMERIRQDYTVRNYLWTGDLDTSSFDPHCQFTDPTLSFRGTDQFVRNVQNLRPYVDALVTSCQSDLLDIHIDTERQYIQTRWNMVGTLNKTPFIPWKPKIDVIGRTKFHYTTKKSNTDNLIYTVYFYDEEWEIPAYQALLQLVTPAGTIPNTQSSSS
jgi:hypothetical protein